MKRGPYKDDKARTAWGERQKRLARESTRSKAARLSWLDPENRKNRTEAIAKAWDDPLLRAIERNRKDSP